MTMSSDLQTKVQHMSLALPPSARAWQAKIKTFVEQELIPHEVEAEMNGGRIDPVVRARQKRMATDLGLPGMDAPRERGGLGLPVVDQIAIYEQIGKVTNGLGWCFSEAHRWMFEACSEEQIQRYVLPIMRGTRHECYAITEEDAGSDVSGLKATARGRLTARQIEAARRAMTRHIKRGGRIWIRIFPDKPISQKPAEVRMGNGKGNPEYYVAEIQPGKVLYEINGVAEELAREAFTLAAAKLPLKCTFVMRQVGA